MSGPGGGEPSRVPAGVERIAAEQMGRLVDSGQARPLLPGYWPTPVRLDGHWWYVPADTGEHGEPDEPDYVRASAAHADSYDRMAARVARAYPAPPAVPDAPARPGTPPPTAAPPDTGEARR